MHIVPTLLCQTIEELQAGIKRWSGVVEVVQVDFADGVFVPNRLPRPVAVNQLKTGLLFECHLMVQQPTEWVKILLLNDQVATVIVHVEAEADISQLSQMVRSAGRLFGLAVRPETAISVVAKYLEEVDEVLLLAIQPGFNGSPFLPSVLDKIRELRQLWPAGLIEIDGGMKPETVALVVGAGASQVAAGSFLQSGDPGARLAELEAAAISRSS
jgi:ribulose-phosphate 3-epimerase